MIPMSPRTMIVVGILMMIVGWLLPFLMILQMLESTFFLNFLSFTLSTAGLFLGMIGAALYYRQRRQ